MHLKARLQRTRTKTENWLYDHPFCKNMLHWSWIFIISTISAALFAFGFSTFIDIVNAEGVSDTIVSGGVSGVSQTIVLILRMCGLHIKDTHLAISIIYFAVNVPLMVVAWLKIGRQFAVFTIINVVEASLFIKIINVNTIPALQYVVEFVAENGGGLLGRAMLGGIFIGLSSALAYRMDVSAGGLDVVAYAISLRRSTSIGKYAFIINASNLILFTFLSFAYNNFDFAAFYPQFGRMFYSLIYFFTGTTVVDAINKRNKKVKLQITTELETIGDILIDSVPHGVTVMKGKGVYSGREKYIFTTVVTFPEVSRVVAILQKEDPRAFVETTPISQIYGNFTSKTVK